VITARNAQKDRINELGVEDLLLKTTKHYILSIPWISGEILI